MVTDELGNIEQKIDQLVELANGLQQENLTLRERETELLRERGQLLEKNEQTRQKIEAMIIRLKNLSLEG